MFKAIAQFLQNLFKSPAVKAFENWLVQVFNAEKAQILSQLMTLAVTEVGVLISNQTLTGPDKAAQARNNLINAAKTAGINASVSDINLALEMALTGLKNANAGITVNGQPAPVNKGNVNG